MFPSPPTANGPSSTNAAAPTRPPLVSGFQLGMVAVLVLLGGLIAGIAWFHDDTNTSPEDARREIAAFADAGRLTRARSLVRLFNRDHPDDVDGHLLAGNLALRQEDARMANRSFRTATTLSPSAPAFVGLAKTAVIRKETHNAIGLFEQALSLDPTDPLALGGLGALLASSAVRPRASVPRDPSLDRGLVLTARAMFFVPSSPQAHLDRAIALHFAGEWPGRDKAVDQAKTLGGARFTARIRALESFFLRHKDPASAVFAAPF